MPQKFRYYQTEADNAICEELAINNKCIVKMFCGTGKSLLMRYCKVVKKQKLCVFVFPSLSLIDQFTNDYLNDFPQENLLKISSELESTTDPKEIIKFLKRKKNKIICITYQSYKTLLDNLGETKINVCIFDEAHHVVAITYQKLIFENELCEKQIFFTATPKNENGIIMYDRQQPDAGMCGKLVYDYSYLNGVNEDYLNPFEIRIDFSTKDTNISLYESICRAIIASGNNRVLTFHSDVNTRRDKSVKNFVNENQFIECFNEFSEKRGFYKKITMVESSSDISSNDRKKLLKDFDETPDDEIYIISSCETMGEGIDTKNANMCVFIDPKSSFVKIIQNIGRIVRKQLGIDKPKSTILIPCWVDKEKYLECGGDREKCDEVIRQDINKDGNFNGILNVMSALRQEDEDIYDICLHYPDTYSPQEIRSNLEKQGYKIEEPIGEGYLMENLEYMIGSELDYEEYEDCDSDEEIISRVAEDNNVCVEIHTTSLENPIEKYNSECKSGNVVRLYKTTTDEEEETETIYQPIVNKNNSKKNKDVITNPRREKRFNINVHTNPDMKVLWNIANNIDITQNICSCILDCEVVDTWFERLEELKGFINTNEKRPSSTSKNEKEQKLGSWITTQIKNHKKKDRAMKDENKRKLCEEFIKEYKKYFVDLDIKWVELLEKVKTFIREKSELPKSSSENDKEKLLSTWIIRQKGNYINKKDGMKDENRRKLWKKFIEEYKEYFEIWDDLLEKVKKFINDNKRRPNVHSENEKEVTIASWLGRNIQNFKNNKMNEEIKVKWEEFVEAYKIYFKDLDEIWNIHFNELKQYFIDNKKLPSKVKKWVTHQNSNYKNNQCSMKDKNKKKIWDEFKDFCFNWDNTLIELKKFINKNNKIPYEKSKKETEKNLGQWLSHQITNYKDNIMNKERRKVWKEFIDSYPDLFKKEEGEEEIEKPKEKKKKSMKLKFIIISKKENTEERKNRVKSEISILHQKYKTMNSQNLNKEFKENQELWKKYHEISEENEKSFPEEEIPRNRIIAELDKIKTKRTKVVVDMGCGKGQISEHFKSKNDTRFQFKNYDHISENDNVISCDISSLNDLEDDSVDICILSLAMWGSNCKEYVKEANRILESNGRLFIIEATKRWSEKDDSGNIIEGKEGTRLYELLIENGFQIINSSKEKFCLFDCVKR
jgi:superfamily II DNA or RNA helicase